VIHQQEALFNGHSGCFCEIADLQLFEYPIDMVAHGELADAQGLTDRFVGKPFCQQLQDFQLARAEDSFNRALQSCPESLPALEGAAQIAYSTRAPAAADLLHRSLLLRPDDQTTHAMLGSVSFQHGDCSAAVEHFERSLLLVAKSEEAQRELGSCFVSQGEHQ
jgi:Flp pilus assembly protein TadD